MTDKQRIEAIRARINATMTATEFEEELAKGIVGISMQTSEKIDDILEWSWPKFEAVVFCFKEIGEEMNRQTKTGSQGQLTLA